MRSVDRIVRKRGLCVVDFTTARRLLADSDPLLSLDRLRRRFSPQERPRRTRDWRGRLVEHRHGDVQALIEVATSQGPMGWCTWSGDAEVRGVAEISAYLPSRTTPPPRRRDAC